MNWFWFFPSEGFSTKFVLSISTEIPLAHYFIWNWAEKFCSLLFSKVGESFDEIKIFDFWSQLRSCRASASSRCAFLNSTFKGFESIKLNAKKEQLTGIRFFQTRPSLQAQQRAAKKPYLLRRYIHLLANYKLNVQMRAACDAFRNGLASVLPIEWLRMFDHREFQTLISGAESPISVGDMKENAVYSGETQFSSVHSPFLSLTLYFCISGVQSQTKL